MVTIEELTIAYRTFVDARNDRNLERYEQIAAQFTQERLANGDTREQIRDAIFNATWGIEDRTSLNTTTLHGDGRVHFTRTPTDNAFLAEMRANFLQDITNFVNNILGPRVRTAARPM